MCLQPPLALKQWLPHRDIQGYHCAEAGPNCHAFLSFLCIGKKIYIHTWGWGGGSVNKVLEDQSSDPQHLRKSLGVAVHELVIPVTSRSLGLGAQPVRLCE